MRILIAGAGVTGRRLVGRLASGRNEVVVIDLNRELCEAISAELGVVAICGNATDIATLEEAEISRVDLAVGLMRSNADNLAFSLLARGAGVGRVIAKMPNPKYRAAYERAGVTTIIDVASMFIDRLVFEIERPPVHQVAAIADGQGAIVWGTEGRCSAPLPVRSRSPPPRRSGIARRNDRGADARCRSVRSEEEYSIAHPSSPHAERSGRGGPGTVGGLRGRRAGGTGRLIAQGRSSPGG